MPDPEQECRVWLAEAYAVWLLAREYDQGRWPYTRQEMAWIVATQYLQAISGRRLPDALAALARLSHAWHQVEPHREPPLQICATCREAVLEALASMFVPVVGTRPTLDGTTVMGCTFSDGPLEQCALHPWLHEDDAPG